MSYNPPKKTIDLTDNPTVIWDQLKSPLARLTINGDRTLQIINAVDGDSYLHVTIGAAGGHTLAYESAIEWAAGTPPEVTPTAAAKTKLHFIGENGTVTGQALFDAQSQ